MIIMLITKMIMKMMIVRLMMKMMIAMLIMMMMMVMLIMMLDSCSVAAQYAGGWGLDVVDDMRPQPRQKKTLFHLYRIWP